MQALRRLFEPAPSAPQSLRPHFPAPRSSDILVIRWRGAKLLDLPAELVFVILGMVAIPDVLSFGLSSNTSYRLALPVLYRSAVIAQQDGPSFDSKIKAGDPRLGNIQCIQLGRLDKPGYGEKWNISEILSTFLVHFSALHELEMCGGTYVKGWDGLDEIGAVLGEKLTKLQIKLSPPLSSPEPPPKVSFKCLRSLDVFYMRGKEYPPARDIDNILHDFSSRFPTLFQFRLYCSMLTDHNGLHLFSGTTKVVHFPELQAFDLSAGFFIGAISQREADGLSRFLQLHARTIRSLSLPNWKFDPEILFESPPDLNLRRLTGSIGLANRLLSFELGKSADQAQHLFSEDLQKLSIDFNGMARDAVFYSPFRNRLDDAVKTAAENWLYKDLRSLTIIQPEIRTDFEAIPMFCPNLEELEFDFSPWDSAQATFDTSRSAVLNALPKLRKVVTGTTGRERVDWKVVRRGGVVRLETVTIFDPRRTPTRNYWSFK